MGQTLQIRSNIPNIERSVRALQQNLPHLISNEAKNHFVEGFSKGGGQTDNSAAGWKKRTSKNKSDRRNRRNRAILVSSGQLRNDLDVRKTTFKEIVIGTLDTDYGIYHNEGKYPQPQREFLGDSRVLMQKINRLTKMQFQRVFE